MIGQALEGLLDNAISTYYKRSDGHNFFVRKSDLADYRTYDQIIALIQDAMTGNDVDYYRVFTLYQRTDSPTIAPARPTVGV